MYDGAGFTWSGKIGDEMKFHGIDPSGRCRVIARQKSVIAVYKFPGSCWTSLGAPHQYVGAKVRIYKIKRDKERDCDAGRGWYVVRELIEFPVSSMRKKEIHGD